MAGTGLPTGGNGRPVLLQPSPEVQPTAAIAEAQAWGLASRSASHVSDAALSIAAQAQEQEKLKWAADFEVAARTKRIELQGQYPDNPDAFKKEWQAYTDGALGGVPLAYADHARRTLGMEGVSSLASIQGAAIAKTRALTADSVKARLDAAQTDVLGYAYRGDMNNERFVQGLADFRGYLNDGVKAGLWSQDHADLKADELAGKAKAEAIVGRAKSLFETKGPEGAFQEAETLLNDPKLGLTPNEVESYRGRVGAEINKWSGFQSADRQKIAVEAEVMKDRFKVGTANGDEVNALVQRAMSVRDYRTASELTRGFQRQEALANEAWKPPTETANTIRSLQEKARAAPADAVPIAPGDREALIRTALAEAGNQGPDGLAGVIYTVLNRTKHPGWGGTVDSVINQKNQFEPVMKAGGDWRNLPPGSDAQRAAVGQIIDEIAAGKRPDPTGGATYFLNRKISAERGTDFGAGKDQFMSATIGDHTFYRPGLFGEKATPVPSFTVRPGVDPDLIKDMEAANAKKMEALKSDPLGYVSGLRDAPKLPTVDWSQPNAAATALQERQRTAAATASIFGIGPVPALTKPEIDQLSAAWKLMGSNSRAQVLGVLGRSLSPDVLAATTEKIAGDLPSMAWAANLYQRSPDTAIAVVRGESALEATPGLVPADSSAFRTAVDNTLGTAMSKSPLMREQMVKAARAHYADAKAKAGDTSGKLDSDQMEKSINAVTGNVITWRGQKLIAPQYGMTTSGFSDIMDSLTDADLAGARIPSGRIVTPRDIQKFGTLYDAGAGQYRVVLNDNVPVFGADGRPFTLDLSQKKAQSWADRPLMDDAQRQQEQRTRENVDYLRQTQAVQ